MDKGFDLIVAIVNRGFSDLVMDAARAAGASGGTILHGRGTGVHEAVQFFGVAIHPEKEIVLILTRTEERHKIMAAIAEGAELNCAGPRPDLLPSRGRGFRHRAPAGRG